MNLDSGARPLEHAAHGAAPRPMLRPRGSNHVGMRQFNERVVLQAIRAHGSLPKADLARLTGRSSPLGELIDGICDYASHVVLYIILVVVLAPSIAAAS